LDSQSDSKCSGSKTTASGDACKETENKGIRNTSVIMLDRRYHVQQWTIVRENCMQSCKQSPNHNWQQETQLKLALIETELRKIPVKPTIKTNFACSNDIERLEKGKKLSKQLCNT
jgi:hypothetical protein